MYTLDNVILSLRSLLEETSFIMYNVYIRQCYIITSYSIIVLVL